MEEIKSASFSSENLNKKSSSKYLEGAKKMLKSAHKTKKVNKAILEANIHENPHGHSTYMISNKEIISNKEQDDDTKGV